MKRVLMGLALASAALQAGHLLACGDKFLVIGRGVRGQRLKGAVHHATILMYLSPTGGLTTAVGETGLDRELKLAGHQLRSVADRAELDSALAAGGWDLVLAGIADMTSLEPLVGAAPSRPTLLPIIYNPTGDELAAAKKAYSCVMRSPSTRQGYLSVIEDALARRSKRSAPGTR